MTTSIEELITEASTTLGDLEQIRWPATELLKYLSDAQRAAVLLKPEINPNVMDFQLASSSKQTLPDDAFILIDVTANVDVNNNVRTIGEVISPVDRKTLDQSFPLWNRLDASATVTPENYVYDIRNRKSFYLYPVRVFSNRDHIELIYAKTPAELTPDDTATELDAIYRPALLAYMLHRALAKKTDNPAESGFEDSVAYFNQFRLLLTGESDEEASELTIRHQLAENSAQGR